MPYFTKKELIMSLFFPVIISLWGAFDFVFGLPWDRDPAELGFRNFLYPLVGLVMLLAGGVLPAVLTWRQKIRTDGFLFLRLIVIAVVYALNRLVERYAFPGETSLTFFLLPLIINVTAVVLQIMMFNKLDNVTKSELTVIILSDPILWWTVRYLALYV